MAHASENGFLTKTLDKEFQAYIRPGIKFVSISPEILFQGLMADSEKRNRITVDLASLLGPNILDPETDIVSFLYADARVSKLGSIPFATRLTANIDVETLDICNTQQHVIITNTSYYDYDSADNESKSQVVRCHGVPLEGSPGISTSGQFTVIREFDPRRNGLHHVDLIADIAGFKAPNLNADPEKGLLVATFSEADRAWFMPVNLFNFILTHVFKWKNQQQFSELDDTDHFTKEWINHVNLSEANEGRVYLKLTDVELGRLIEHTEIVAKQLLRGVAWNTKDKRIWFDLFVNPLIHHADAHKSDSYASKAHGHWTAIQYRIQLAIVKRTH